jgi:hypothetical protein
MSTYVQALDRGEREAARRNAEAREIAASAGALRDLGFPARDDECDDDF